MREYTNQEISHIIDLAAHGKTKSVRTRYTNLANKIYKSLSRRANYRLSKGGGNSDLVRNYLNVRGYKGFNKSLTGNTLEGLNVAMQRANAYIRSYSGAVYLENANSEVFKNLLVEKYQMSVDEIKDFFEYIHDRDVRLLIDELAGGADKGGSPIVIENLLEVYQEDGGAELLRNMLERYQATRRLEANNYFWENFRYDVIELFAR